GAADDDFDDDDAGLDDAESDELCRVLGALPVECVVRATGVV
ncbi:MAG: hypothetical protein QOH89_2340, partial [Pseudonocardiales bacterium]|nr:hypothetical protein [Pseudonocardiales bacterium]